MINWLKFLAAWRERLPEVDQVIADHLHKEQESHRRQLAEQLLEMASTEEHKVLRMRRAK